MIPFLCSAFPYSIFVHPRAKQNKPHKYKPPQVPNKHVSLSCFLRRPQQRRRLPRPFLFLLPATIRVSSPPPLPLSTFHLPTSPPFSASQLSFPSVLHRLLDLPNPAHSHSIQTRKPPPPPSRLHPRPRRRRRRLQTRVDGDPQQRAGAEELAWFAVLCQRGQEWRGNLIVLSRGKNGKAEGVGDIGWWM